MLQKKYKSLIALTAALLSGGMLPCLQAAVVTSVKPLGFIAAAISDGVTPVEVVLPDGASEHDYALRPSDMRRVQGADLLVWIGPEMESFLTRSAGQLAPQKNLMLAGLSSVQTRLIAGHNDDEDQHTASEKNANSDGNPELSGGHHHHGEYNMHLWMSPEIALLSATAIHDRLVELMPAKKDKLDSNLMTFKVRLADADNRIRKQLAPVSLKGYFVFHDAYSYFEKHYGLSPAGHFTVNPEIQPGAQKLHNIRTQLVQQKAVCVFAEPQFRPAVIDVVARGTNVRKGILDPLGMSISLDKDSYVNFLSQLSSQYASCLKG